MAEILSLEQRRRTAARCSLVCSRQFYSRQIGRARGDDIVQEGTDATGVPIRWTFTDITPNSFRWTGERSEDGGRTYWLQAEFLATRLSS